MYEAMAEAEKNNETDRKGTLATKHSQAIENARDVSPMKIGASVCTLVHSNWMPPQESPMRNVARPPTKKKPPTQSTRASLEAKEVFSVVNLTYRGMRTNPAAQNGN
jgi:hypothetical protein